MTTILSGDASFIVDGAPIARGGDVTSCGAKLIASQQAFAESGFSVGSIAQAAPLVFAKSEPEALFSSLTASDAPEGNIIAGNTYYGEPDQGGGGDTLINSSDVDKTIEELRRSEFREASQGFTTPSSTPYNPGRAWDDEKLKRHTRVYGEQSATGKQTIEGLDNSGGLANYRSEQEQTVKNRTQNIATRTAQKLDVKNTPPPSLNNEFGYENPMAKVRDGWKGELADGGKKTAGILDDSLQQVNKGYAAARTGADSILNRDVDGLKDQAADKATDTSKGKLIDKAKNLAPKPVRKAWDAYDDYNAVKEKGTEIKDAIPKDD